MSTTDTIVLVRPDHFCFNVQTAESNSFMNRVTDIKDEKITNLALTEFTNMVSVLEKNKIQVIVVPSRTDVITPDAVFPNNWFSTDKKGNLIIYPMLTENRRAEKQVDNLKIVLQENGCKIKSIIDWSHHEKNGKILEGTGSIVFSRKHNIAFAISSARTDKQLFEDYCKYFGYKAVFFHAYDSQLKPVYHTNVIIAVGDEFVVLCSESIKDVNERNKVHD
ncbi:MAG: arginine deiminase-related protein, partial [bacterium]|nr:arginine deiminase-related protein [bacterium]